MEKINSELKDADNKERTTKMKRLSTPPSDP